MLQVYLSILLTVVFWGSAFVGIRLSLEGYSPVSLALLRALVACLCATLIHLKNKETYLCVSFLDRAKAMLLGMLGMGIYSLALAIGEETVPAGIAAFIVGQMPLLASLFAAFFLKEKIQPRLWAGILISISGLALISVSGLDSFTMQSGILFVMVSTFCGAAFTCLQKPLLRRMDALNFTTHAIWGSTLFLIVVSFLTKAPVLLELNHATWQATSSVVYLGLFPSLVAYIGWSYAVSRINIAKAGVLLYGMPLVGAFLAWIVLFEKPRPLAFVGMALAFVGCLVGSLRLKGKPKPIRVVTN